MTEETNKQAEELTPEQLTAQRLKVINYYTAQIDVLKVQAEYEKLLAEIEESRAKRMSMIISQARMSQGPADEEQEQEQDPETEAKAPEEVQVPKERKLKKA
jgi:hypothetical protein